MALTINGITFNEEQITKQEIKHVDGKDVCSVWLDNGTRITFTEQDREDASVYTRGQKTVINNVSGAHIEGNPNTSDTIVLGGYSDRNTIDVCYYDKEQNLWQKFIGLLGLNNKDKDSVVMDSISKDNEVIYDDGDSIKNDVYPMGKQYGPTVTLEDGSQGVFYDMVNYSDVELNPEGYSGWSDQEFLIKEAIGEERYNEYKAQQNAARRGK